jgi:AraC family transcriptional regulator of adaptative response/methylated-DNA-[protein]-cysteine methyltransferase
MNIGYTIADSRLGRLLVAGTERGISATYVGDTDEELEQALHKEYPAATIERDDARLQPWVAAILQQIDGQQPRIDLPLDVQGTAFQRRVWEALRTIPSGSTRSYAQVAEQLGQPKAVRAVAQACASNPAAIVTPCHRVVRSDGSLSGYRWGVERKEALLAAERSMSAE